MRRRLLLGALVVVGSTACAVPAPRTFSAEFPRIVLDRQYGVEVDPIPVTLLDGTGMAVSLEVVDGGFGMESGLIAGQAGAYLGTWSGDSCIGHVRLALRVRPPETFVLEVREEPALSALLGCAGVGITRAVIIRFAGAAPPEIVVEGPHEPSDHVMPPRGGDPD